MQEYSAEANAGIKPDEERRRSGLRAMIFELIRCAARDHSRFNYFSPVIAKFAVSLKQKAPFGL